MTHDTNKSDDPDVVPDEADRPGVRPRQPMPKGAPVASGDMTSASKRTADVGDTAQGHGNNEHEWAENSEIRELKGQDIVLDATTVSLMVQLARVRTSEEAGRLRLSLIRSLGADGDGAAELVDALHERACALEHQRLLAGRDELTGVSNRRSFNEALKREVARAQRSGRNLSLLMLDLDGLKAINDMHGHPAGDGAIQAVANACVAAVRDTDQVARLGGDEFAVILPEADGDEAASIGERVRRKLAKRPPDGLTIEVSYGHARLGEEVTDEQDLTAAADRALYNNKHARSHRG